MARRLSTAARTLLASGAPLHEVFADFRIYGYAGVQPAAADDAPSGTNGIIYTLNGGTYTSPIKATATITISGVAGSVDTIKVGGAIPLIGAAVANTGAVNTTADAVAAAINAYSNPLGITATTTGASGVVTLHAPYSMGADANGLTVATTVTTTVATPTNFAGGVSAVNGLNFLYPAAAGVLSKEADVWQGTVIADITLGWVRLVAGGSAAAGSSTTDVRLDLAAAVSGSDFNVTSTTFTTGQVKLITAGTLTVPASS